MYRTADFAKLAAAHDIANFDIANFFDRWTKARSQFLPHLPPGSNKWSPTLGEELYSAELWQLTKTWELTQQNQLEAHHQLEANQGAGGGPSSAVHATEPRFWSNTIPAGTAPAEAGIPDGPNGMGGSGLTNEYFNNAWYELQVVLNSGGHTHRGKLPIDWPYLIGRFQNLHELSGRPEPGRLLIAVIKAMQSSDPALGPENIREGWRPDQNIDPRIMIAKDWAPIFAPLSNSLKRAITESMLTAWLDKIQQYRPASYFHLGVLPGSYVPPADLRDISGGKAWETLPQFQAAGVDPQLLERLRKWGLAYSDLAGLYHY
jgi:hypothetical protein